MSAWADKIDPEADRCRKGATREQRVRLSLVPLELGTAPSPWLSLRVLPRHPRRWIPRDSRRRRATLAVGPTTTNMKDWQVYIAQCSDGSLYTGITTNIESRLKRHNKGRGSKYVWSKGRAILVYTEWQPNKTSALRRELEIKSWNRTKKLSLVQLPHRSRLTDA